MIEYDKLKMGDELYFKGENKDGTSRIGSSHDSYNGFYGNPVFFRRIKKVFSDGVVVTVFSRRKNKELDFDLNYFGLERYS